MDKLFVIFICAFFILYITVRGDAETRTGNGSHQGEEGRLIRHLLDTGYDVRERPFVQDGGPVLFNLSLHLSAISDLNPRTQVLSGISWFIVDWYDDRLTWDPKDYAGIGSFTVNIDQTWSPKLYLQNTLLFTTQNTPIHLVKLDTTKIGIANPNVSAEYNIIGSSTSSHYVTLPGNVTYEIMGMGFKLVRLPRFYVQNVTLPITFLSWLSIVIFIIPAKSGERLSAAISLVLGLTVFQIVITDNLPKSSRGKTAPVISYVSECFIITIVAAIMSAIVINVSHQKGIIQNKFFRSVLFDYVGPWFLVGGVGCGKKKAPDSNPKECCKVGDLEMKDKAEKALSNESHDKSHLTQILTRFGQPTQSEMPEKKEDFEVLAQFLDRIFFLGILVALLVITLKFMMICNEPLATS